MLTNRKVSGEFRSELLGVLLIKVSKAIAGPRKCLATRRIMARECALEVNGIFVAMEILVKHKSLGISTACNIM